MSLFPSAPCRRESQKRYPTPIWSAPWTREWSTIFIPSINVPWENGWHFRQFIMSMEKRFFPNRRKSPVLQKKSGRISVKLLHCGDGLCIHGNKVDAMRLIVNGKEQKELSVSAEGDTLIVACPAIQEDSRIELSYVQVGFCSVDIFNSAGIPVRPFQVKL